MGAAYMQSLKKSDMSDDEFAEYLAGMVYMWEKSVLPRYFLELCLEGSIFATMGWQDGVSFLNKKHNDFIVNPR